MGAVIQPLFIFVLTYCNMYGIMIMPIKVNAKGETEMTDVIRCPYCKSQMELRVLGMNKNKIYFYECPKCLSRSPQTWNEVTANSMARMTETKRSGQA